MILVLCLYLLTWHPFTLHHSHPSIHRVCLPSVALKPYCCTDKGARVATANCLSLTRLPSVLWHCWLGGRKGIRPVKKLSAGVLAVVICLERGAHLHMAQLMPLPLTVSCSSKIQIGLPFWYRLTWVVPDKGPLNGCVCDMWQWDQASNSGERGKIW